MSVDYSNLKVKPNNCEVYLSCTLRKRNINMQKIHENQFIYYNDNNLVTKIECIIDESLNILVYILLADRDIFKEFREQFERDMQNKHEILIDIRLLNEKSFKMTIYKIKNSQRMLILEDIKKEFNNRLENAFQFIAYEFNINLSNYFKQHQESILNSYTYELRSLIKGLYSKFITSTTTQAITHIEFFSTKTNINYLQSLMNDFLTQKISNKQANKSDYELLKGCLGYTSLIDDTIKIFKNKFSIEIDDINYQFVYKGSYIHIIFFNVLGKWIISNYRKI